MSDLIRVREAMAARSVEELERICSSEAAEYTAEAIELARAELVARGRDVTSLVPEKELKERSDRSYLYATSGLGLFVVAVALSIAVSDAPGWVRSCVRIIVWAAFMSFAWMWWRARR